MLGVQTYCIKLLLLVLICIVFHTYAHIGHEHENDEDTSHINHNHGRSWTHNVTIKKMTGIDLKWNITDPDWIYMEMTTRTTGYIAVGFCPKWHGSMTGCDIVLGWVNDKDGEVILIDYHSESNDHPIVDESQDYELLYGKQENYVTTIGFRRKWNTNDVHDSPLGDNLVQIIYAWHPMDPMNSTSLFPHDKNTRSHTTKMISMKTKQQNVPAQPLLSNNNNNNNDTNNNGNSIFISFNYCLVLGLICNFMILK